MDTSSFLTSFLIFVVLVLLFLYLSQKPGNEVVYFPNRILKGLEPREGSRGPFAWVRGAFGASEQELVDLAGVDAAVYIVFLGSAGALFSPRCGGSFFDNGRGHFRKKREDCHEWKEMRRAYSGVWDMANPPRGSLNLRLQVSGEDGQKPILPLGQVIPGDWKCGAVYDSNLQLH